MPRGRLFDIPGGIYEYNDKNNQLIPLDLNTKFSPEDYQYLIVTHGTYATLYTYEWDTERWVSLLDGGSRKIPGVDLGNLGATSDWEGLYVINFSNEIPYEFLVNFPNVKLGVVFEVHHVYNGYIEDSTHLYEGDFVVWQTTQGIKAIPLDEQLEHHFKLPESIVDDITEIGKLQVTNEELI